MKDIVNAASAVKQLFSGRLPGQLVVQITNRCNAQCPQCGMRTSENYSRSDLRMDDVKRIIDAAAARGVQAISFTGGEPFLRMRELTELICHAGRAGIPYIRTGTNGFLFMRHDSPTFLDRISRLGDELAATPLRNLWISVDSANPEAHERMRGLPGLTEGIRKALPALHARGIFPAANLGLNRNLGGALLPHIGASLESQWLFYETLRQGLQLFYRHVIDLGFSMVNTCYPMSDGAMADTANLKAVYAASSSDDVVNFSVRERAVLFMTLLQIIPEFRSKVRVFSPLCSVFSLARQYEQGIKTAFGCRGGVDFFFIDAVAADTFPCGYRGQENLGKIWDLDLGRLPSESNCVACDWECFRDPSELLGPFLLLARHPLRGLSHLLRDREMRRLWIQDLSYYRACDYFDGRIPLNTRRLAAFPSSCGTVPRIDCIDPSAHPSQA